MSRRSELLSRLQAEVDLINRNNGKEQVAVRCTSGNRASMPVYEVTVRTATVHCDCPRDAFNVLKGISVAL